MAKVKNKRNSGLADKVHNKKKSEVTKKKLNPFEVHINKEKLKVLGKKSKSDRGLPGVSRNKAMQKRKETLGVEMKLMNKSNTFIDRRIGEKNSQLSSEDRMLARFAAENAKRHSKKNIYNLADDEVLTHRGQSLEQIEKFDDPRSSDEEDEDGRKFGGLDDEFVSEGHFGGGILSKTNSKDGAKSHKDLIEQLIAESKKRKAEKQKEKEQTLDLTEKLDTEWKDLKPVVFKRPRVEEKNEPSIIDKLLSQTEKKSEDYDKTMRELRFEKRGTPSDGLKNEEELAKEEKQKLEKYEREREQRMHDVDHDVPFRDTSKHRSADDLDDNFDLDDEPTVMLAYDKDGKPLVPEHILKANSVAENKKKFDATGPESSSDDDDDDDKSEADDDQNQKEDEQKEPAGMVNDKNLTKENIDSKKVSTGMYNEKNLANEKVDSYIQEDEEDDADEDDDDEEDDNKSDSGDSAHESSVKVEVKDDFEDLKQSDVESDVEIDNTDVTNEIKSFFDFETAEGDNLKELLSGKSPSQHSLVLQKLIKSYDPGLNKNNKENLSRLYAHLLQYLNYVFTGLTTEEDVKRSFEIFNKIAPFFYDLAKINVVSTKTYLMELLKEKYQQFKKRPKRVPDLDTLVFFKLVSLLYPTSDFKHPVVTPSFVFITDILRMAKFNDAYSISRGIFLATLISEYTVLSKRYVPAMVNFLRGIFYLSANTSVLNPVQVVPPFRLHKDEKVLNLERDCRKMEVSVKMAAKDFVFNVIDDDFKIRSLLTCVNVLKQSFDNMNELEAQTFVFEPHLNLLSRVDLEMYPNKVNSIITEKLQNMKEALEVKTFVPLTREKKRPKALRLYEPDIQDVFTGSKNSKLSREKIESDKLKHKYKKEIKGALREIRRDKAFVASMKIKQKIRSDNVRKEKVKQIFKDASIQQGELNKLKRMK